MDARPPKPHVHTTTGPKLHAEFHAVQERGAEIWSTSSIGRPL